MTKVIDIIFSLKFIHYVGEIRDHKGHFSVLKSWGVINDSFVGQSLVMIFKAGTVSVLDLQDIYQGRDVGSATVISSILNGKTLIFKQKNGLFTDTETGSLWDIARPCVTGVLKGRMLIPVSMVITLHLPGLVCIRLLKSTNHDYEERSIYLLKPYYVIVYLCRVAHIARSAWGGVAGKKSLWSVGRQQYRSRFTLYVFAWDGSWKALSQAPFRLCCGG